MNIPYDLQMTVELILKKNHIINSQESIEINGTLKLEGRIIITIDKEYTLIITSNGQMLKFKGIYILLNHKWLMIN